MLMPHRRKRKDVRVAVPPFGNISPIEVQAENQSIANLIDDRNKKKDLASTRIHLLTSHNATKKEPHLDGEIEIGPDFMGKNNENLAGELREIKDRLYVWMKTTDNRFDGIQAQLNYLNRHNQLVNERLSQQEMHVDRLRNIMDRVRNFLKLKKA